MTLLFRGDGAVGNQECNLLPYIGRDWLAHHYNQLEIMRLELYDKICETKESLKEEGVEFDTGFIDSEAVCGGGVLKIVVKDYPPRKCLAESKISQRLLRYRWVKSVVDAVGKLRTGGIYPVFEKAHCVITVYLPLSTSNWDIDNRALKFIIDGLRYSGIIADDTADKLAYTVIGEMDKDFPRTEIILVEHKHILQMLELITML